MRTVWVYTNAAQRGGDDNLKLFESPGVFERWKETNDPDAIAIEYVVIDAENVNKFRSTVGAKQSTSRGGRREIAPRVVAA